MTAPDPITIWTIIAGLAIGSYGLRFVFIGLIGDRPMPPWLLRHLRYTAAAILPALIAPLVVWPTATGGQPDLPRMSAAVVALSVGLITRNVLAAIFAGAGTLYGMLYLLG
ncbi:branched-chain amino acid transport [Ruegeria lacuscaerulensis ITI-1157]|uniref:Branched-chain amino acid transport protein n=1 Tax=Ruegeria intermedia TaxID=996115 RepID=A0A1M5B0W3_9RHOB|nr:AzlD domain-containing protein [Ruegeria intermedia]EEX08669.1 branched-chain amino acid transport [Ruegeria lacuscaerulensis ITI-1157]SHF35812.1 Branched-chain amino acid transport protein [Ruegeria intermedia]SHJ39996.1 Branched-chain amino acid transport protein [Ruegeria lacuscaerulensis ITI-1157]